MNQKTVSDHIDTVPELRFAEEQKQLVDFIIHKTGYNIQTEERTKMSHEITQNYDAISDRIQSSYLAYRRQYETMHPQPQRPLREARTDWLMRLSLLVMTIAGMIVSASHTIVIFAFGRSIAIGGAASVMIEGGAMVMSYYFTRQRYRESGFGQTDTSYIMKYLKAGSLFAVVVMVAGNIQDVLSIEGFGGGNLWTAVKLPIAFLVAFSAPVMVFLAGHVLALLSVMDLEADQETEAGYQAILKRWDEELQRSWNASKRKSEWSVRVEPVNSPLLQQAGTSVTSVTVNPVTVSAVTAVTETDLLQLSATMRKLVEKFRSEPELLQVPSRKLEERWNKNVSHQTIHRAQVIVRDMLNKHGGAS